MKSWTGLFAATTLLFGATSVLADPPKAVPAAKAAAPAPAPAPAAPARSPAAPAPSPAAAPAAASSATASRPEFASCLGGIFLGAEAGTGVYGYELSGNLGAQMQCLQSLQGRQFVLRWNAGAQGIGGVLANTHPYNAIYGLRAQAGGEAGVRLIPSWTFSPYIGVAGAASGHAVAVAGVSPTALNTVNNTDGIAGVAGSVRGRFNVGGSILTGSNSLMLLTFVQEELRSPQTVAPAAAYTDVGLRAQYDLSHSLSAGVEASLGTTGQQEDRALGRTNRTTRWAIAGDATKTFGDHWLGTLGLTVSREGTETSTAGSALVFDTAAPITAFINLGVGYKP